MQHWCETYLSRPFTEQMDCFGHFRAIQSEVFARDVPDIMIDHARLTMAAARAMAGDISGFGVSPTDAPGDGDAAFLSQRCRPHHIGTIAMISGKLHVVHAIEKFGVVIDDLISLKTNGWRIAGYWTWT